MIAAGIHGLLLSFGLILPLGVQNIFVFNQGAAQREWIKALPAVITAALCDTLLISMAVFGVSAVVFGYAWLKILLIGAGILFLCYMGYLTWKSQPGSHSSADKQPFSAKKQILFSASVSLLNPHAIMDTIGVIGTSSLSYSGLEKMVFTLACILVSWIWFIGLSVTGRFVGTLDATGRIQLMINKISAIIMWGTACYLVFSI